MSDAPRQVAPFLSLLAVTVLGGCGGPIERAETALAQGNAELAIAEASRAVRRDERGGGLILVDALIFAGDIEGAQVALDGLEGVPAVEVRRRQLRIAERSDDWREFARAWLAGFEASETHAPPLEPEFFGEVLRQLLDDRQAAALALLTALPEHGATDQDISRAIDHSLDQALYQMHYRGESIAVGHTARAVALIVGDRNVLRKHELAARLARRQRSSSAEPGGLAEHALQIAGGAEGLARLAEEFSVHGAYTAGAAAFEIAAEAAPDRAVLWLRGAANAQYAAGNRDAARELLERATAGSMSPDDLSAAFDVALRHGDEAHEFGFVGRAADAPCESGEIVATGEALRARRLIASGQAELASDQIVTRLASCPIPGMAATVGMAILESEQPELAEPLLYLAALDRFAEPDLVRLYLSLASRAEAKERALEVARLAAGAAFGSSSSVQHTVATYHALNESTVAGVREVAVDLIARAVELTPGSFELVSELAAHHLRAGDEVSALATLDSYIDAAPDRLVALLAVARWLEDQLNDHGRIAEAYARAGSHPNAGRRFETFGRRSAAEHAWSRAAHHYLAAGDAARTTAALWAFADAAGRGRYATWDEIWSREAFFELLPPVEVIGFGETALRAGLEESRVHLRLGAAYQTQGDASAARDAYVLAVTADPLVLDELMDRLDDPEDGATLIAVLHSIPPEDRTFGAWAALVEAHAAEAIAAPPALRRAEHRVDARRAFSNAIALNPSASFQAHELADAGLHDLAAHLHRRDLESDPTNRVALQLTLVSLAESGAPRDEIAPLLNRAVEEFEEAALSRLRTTLARRGYLEEALVVGQRQLERSGMSTEGLEATAAAVIGYAADAGRSDLVRTLTHEFFVGPASLLAAPDGLPPSRYAGVADRDSRAAALLRTASGLYETAGLWALAEEAALDALRLTRSHSHQIVARCVLSAIRARGGELSVSLLSEIADILGGSAREWRLLGTILGELERPSLERVAWERVLRLVPDDWTALLELAEIAAAGGELQRAESLFRDAVAGARADGREADTALHASRALAAVGRADIAISILELVRDTPRVDVVLADFELGAGLTARGLRRLASSALAPSEAVRVYLRHGYDAEGVALWERRVRGLEPSVAAELLRTRADVAMDQLPFSRGLALLLDTAAVSDPNVDLRSVEATILALAGRAAEAAAALGDDHSEAASADRHALLAVAALEPDGPSFDGDFPVRQALASGRYEVAIEDLARVDSIDEGAAAQFVALARSGFSEESYALLQPHFEQPFRAGVWQAAISVRPEEVSEAAVIRHGSETALALDLVRTLAEHGQLPAAEELLDRLPLFGPDARLSAGILSTAALAGHGPSRDRLRSAVSSDADRLAVWGAADELALTDIAASAATELDSAGAPPGLRFAAEYVDGDLAGARTTLVEGLPLAMHPRSTLRGAIDITSPSLDRSLRIDLIREALADQPNDVSLLIELIATEGETEDAIGTELLRGALACNPGGTAHVINELVRGGHDRAAVAIGRGCEDLPIRARVLLAVAEGEVPGALDELQPRHAVTYAAEAARRGNFAASYRLADHAASAVFPPAGAFAQRAIAAAHQGDLTAATADAERFLAAASNLLDGGPALLEAMVKAGAYEAVDRIANALLGVPDSYGQVPVGGTAAVLGAFFHGAPAQGVDYLETRLPEVLATAVLRDEYLVIASLFAAGGQTDVAVSLYEQRLELWPRDTVAMNNLAHLLAVHTDRYDEAAALSIRSIAWSGRASPAALDTLARCLQGQGAADEALRLVEVALRSLPRDTSFRAGSSDESALLELASELQASVSTRAQGEEGHGAEPRRRRRR